MSTDPQEVARVKDMVEESIRQSFLDGAGTTDPIVAVTEAWESLGFTVTNARMCGDCVIFDLTWPATVTYTFKIEDKPNGK